VLGNVEGAALLIYVAVFIWGAVRFGYPIFNNGEEIDTVEALGYSAMILQALLAFALSLATGAFAVGLVLAVTDRWVSWERWLGWKSFWLFLMLDAWMVLWVGGREAVKSRGRH